MSASQRKDNDNKQNLASIGNQPWTDNSTYSKQQADNNLQPKYDDDYTNQVFDPSLHPVLPPIETYYPSPNSSSTSYFTAKEEISNSTTALTEKSKYFQLKKAADFPASAFPPLFSSNDDKGFEIESTDERIKWYGMSVLVDTAKKKYEGEIALARACTEKISGDASSSSTGSKLQEMMLPPSL
eukprot:6872388-Ditylum_brightwellii.AAC.1